MKILVAAFDPFGQDEANAALEAVRALPGHIDDAEVVTVEVPTVFGRSVEVVVAAIGAVTAAR